MFHDRTLARQARAADPRPASAVSHGAGIAGMAGLLAWTAAALIYGMDGPYSAMVNVLACAGPMVLWSLVVDKVHRNASTGIGIAPDRLHRIFDAFVTSKPQQGTGLGLSISYALVTRAGGKLSVRSQLNEGSVFTIWLPQQAEEQAEGSDIAVPGSVSES